MRSPCSDAMVAIGPGAKRTLSVMDTFVAMKSADLELQAGRPQFGRTASSAKPTRTRNSAVSLSTSGC